MTIDTLCFYSQDEEDILCLAAISHFIIIVIMCNFISISKKKRIFFWGQLACNYLIIIPKCVCGSILVKWIYTESYST